MRRPMIVPTVPPIVATAANCASTSGEKPTAAREARIPEPTPRIPSVLPWRAVACEDRPDNEPSGNFVRIKDSNPRSKLRTYTKDAAGQIPSLHQTRHACVGCRQEPSCEHYSRNAVKPRILWWISSSYDGPVSMKNQRFQWAIQLLLNISSMRFVITKPPATFTLAKRTDRVPST